jgi:membrane protease YdiL (CAAX protease family)
VTKRRKKRGLVARLQEAATVYLEESRDGGNSLLLTLPVLLAYQAGLLLYPNGPSNAAHALVENLLLKIGPRASMIANLLLCAVFVFVARRRRKAASPFGLLLPVFVESAAYAAALAPAVRALSRSALAMGGLRDEPLRGVVLALGAGFYEELIFRLICVSGGYWVLRRAAGFGPRTSAVAALVVSGALFSAFHHVGPGSEPFTIGAFVFRFAAGNILGLLFVLRGFGVACYTHVLYNVAVLLSTRAG